MVISTERPVRENCSNNVMKAVRKGESTYRKSIETSSLCRSNSRYNSEDTLQNVSEALFRLVRTSRRKIRAEGKVRGPPGKLCRKSGVRKSPQSKFDLDRFMIRSYIVSTPSFPMGCSVPCFAQEERQIAIPPPTIQNIRSFLRVMYTGARLDPECLVVALIYIDRFTNGKRAVALTDRNWLPITMVSLLTASKVWEDNPTWNGAFAQLFPPVPVRGLNKLESAFHSQMQFNLHISRSMYSSYHMTLRTLQARRILSASTTSISDSSSRHRSRN